MLHHALTTATATRPRQVVTLTTVVVLLAAVAAAGWWQLAGPNRFQPLALDDEPTVVPALADRLDADITVPAEPASVEGKPSATFSGPQVWLLTSTGTGVLTADEADQMRMPDGTARTRDRLTDTLMLLIVDPASGDTALLSIPRDTWLFDRGHRINEVYARHGMQALVDDVRDLTGLPVHHVVGVNMRGFVRAVDAAGGVVVATDRPMRDDYAHLPELPAGCWQLTGPDALAYVRSRHTETFDGTSWVTDTTASDFGRAARQREILGGLWDQLRGPKLLTMIPAGMRVVGDDLTLDQGTSVTDLLDLARVGQRIAAGNVESLLLPTSGQRISGAHAQVVADEQAEPLLQRLRSWPPTDADTSDHDTSDLDTGGEASDGSSPSEPTVGSTADGTDTSADVPAGPTTPGTDHDTDHEHDEEGEQPTEPVDPPTLDPATCSARPVPWASS